MITNVKKNREMIFCHFIGISRETGWSFMDNVRPVTRPLVSGVFSIFSQRPDALCHILFKFLIGKVRVPCAHPDPAGQFVAGPAVRQALFISDTVVDRADAALWRMKHLTLAFITASAHFAVTVAAVAVGSADAEGGCTGVFSVL